MKVYVLEAEITTSNDGWLTGTLQVFATEYGAIKGLKAFVEAEVGMDISDDIPLATRTETSLCDDLKLPAGLMVSYGINRMEVKE